MAHTKAYTHTEKSVDFHLQTSVEGDGNHAELQSSISNGKIEYRVKKSFNQLRVKNAELESKVNDLENEFFNHSSDDGSPGELHHTPNGKQENGILVGKNGHYSPNRKFLCNGNNERSDGHHQKNGTLNGKHDESDYHQSNGNTNGKYMSDGQNLSNGSTKGKSGLDEQLNRAELNTLQPSDPVEFHQAIPRGSTYLRSSNGIVETDSLTSGVLSDLFSDKICVLCIKNYASAAVCEKLDAFLRDKGSEEYTHEIRNNGQANLIYFGVNRYGYPLNSSYNDPTGNNLSRYLSEAIPTIRFIRQAARPYLSPIDKFRVEMDEAWHKNVNIASLQGQKTFCGIGRVMPASLSELSEVQPHFDAVPTSYFPQIHKQFTANFYLNVPETGGELEIWDVPPISIDNIENFTIPNDWRAVLPDSIKVKPERGDLLMFNTRRPHAITSFGGSNPRTSVQTFIGLAKNSEVFLWV